MKSEKDLKIKKDSKRDQIKPKREQQSQDKKNNAEKEE